MSATQIEDLQTLLTPIIPKNYKFIDAKLTKLTTAGDNYGSTLLGVDVTIQSDEHQGHIHAVAKKLPLNEFIQRMFNTPYTFPNEVGFYQTIAPSLRHFQQEQGVINLLSSYPDFYAARVTQDENSVLLIKNIRKDGFGILDRTVGFDFEASRLVLGKMAELHGTALGLKQLRPHVFTEKLEPFFREYNIFATDDEANGKMINGILDVVKDDEICSRHLGEIEEIMWRSIVLLVRKNKKLRHSPFSTLVHGDLWTNNIMVKVEDGAVVDVKFVDYQLYEFASLSRDVLFFIFSSVEIEVLKRCCDELLEHYFESLMRCLEGLRCEVEGLTFGAFLDDLKHEAKTIEFFHILSMLPPIYATSKDTKDVEQLDLDNFIFVESEVTEAHREKACYVVTEFMRRGWLL